MYLRSILVVLFTLTSLSECQYVEKFRFDFDDINDVSELLDYVGTVLSRFSFILDRYAYKINETQTNTILLTDAKSISSPAANNASCRIPFAYNGMINYFCVEDVNSDVVCNTTNNQYSPCTLGNFLQVRPARDLNTFKGGFGFYEYMELNETNLYEVDFRYLIKYDDCDRQLLDLKIVLYDDIAFEGVVFDAYDDDEFADRWNRKRACFNVYDGLYQLHLNISNLCNNSRVFFAVDDIVVRQIVKPAPNQRCTIFTNNTWTLTYEEEFTSTIELQETSTDFEMSTIINELSTTDDFSYSTTVTFDDTSLFQSSTSPTFDFDTSSFTNPTDETMSSSYQSVTTDFETSLFSSSTGDIETSSIASSSIGAESSSTVETLSSSFTSLTNQFESSSFSNPTSDIETSSIASSSIGAESSSTVETLSSSYPTLTTDVETSLFSSSTGDSSSLTSNPTFETIITSTSDAQSSTGETSILTTQLVTYDETSTSNQYETTTHAPKTSLPIYLLIIIIVVSVLVLICCTFILILWFCRFKTRRIAPEGESAINDSTILDRILAIFCFFCLRFRTRPIHPTSRAIQTSETVV